MVALSALNALSPTDARAAFLQCCGAHRWAEAMTSARPFATVAALHETSDRLWSGLDRNDWLEAFAAHPRIGERAAVTASARSQGWSAQEQSRATAADTATLESLAQVNREYEARFGHVYLVCASGRGASELLADASQRMHNDAAKELRVAAGEQQKITRLRLARLLEELG